ncbi:hypothetical protein R0131_18020 [Clostridium sp. AL.422]|uniref:hypothetical protein n=1 Tax=Clostridium TaxID=1485 RepID=UPI00293DB538|nr:MULTISPECIES: hypothetical protein [unclassified Clostridium]MDV4152729.1 hypothetical protein [Clostridium sp. AL.422]
MFEVKEEKKPAKDKRITIRFTAEEHAYMQKYIDEHFNEVENFTELIRLALDNFLKN